MSLVRQQVLAAITSAGSPGIEHERLLRAIPATEEDILEALQDLIDDDLIYASETDVADELYYVLNN